MHATKPKQPQKNGDRPLAQSVFDGEARLRELEHLAETARKVRDQAAAELTRNGSTHHIARDRIAAAERMLRKTQKEISELRAQMGPISPSAPPAQANTPQDFELAMLLGHSKARFSREDTSHAPLQLQQDNGARSHGHATRDKRDPSHSSSVSRRSNTSLGRSLVFAVLVALGGGLGAVGTYAVVNTGSVTEAGLFIHEQSQRLLTRLRTLIPALAVTERAAPELVRAEATETVTRADTPKAGIRQAQESQARAAAEQRLARQMAVRAPHP